MHQKASEAGCMAASPHAGARHEAALAALMVSLSNHEGGQGAGGAWFDKLTMRAGD
jgi:hypothetical protein